MPNTSNLERQLRELQQKFAILEREFHFHRHLETDRTRRLFPTAYYGRVEADGTETDIPDGWSVSKTATGKYTITHNLGHSNYGVVVITDFQDDAANNVKISPIEDYDDTIFKVNCIKYPFTAGTDADSDFFFILVKKA